MDFALVEDGEIVDMLDKFKEISMNVSYMHLYL